MAGMIVAAIVSLIWCGFSLWVGPRTGFVDRPDEESGLKVHDRPAVPLGGVGVFLGYHIGVTLEGELDLFVLAATSLVLVLGVADDRWELSPRLRLAVESVAALILAWGVAPGGSPIDFLFVASLAVFAVNAVNLFDGLDGLAATAALVTSVGLAAWSYFEGLTAYAGPLALAGCLVGFLILGWNPARVFLGDSGSYVLGILLVASIVGSTPSGGVDTLLGAAALGVFAIDLIVTILRRRRSGRPLFLGDRSHIYDQLRDRGTSVRGVVYVAAGVQAGLVAAVVAAGVWFPGYVAVALIAVLWLLLVAYLTRRGFLTTRPS